MKRILLITGTLGILVTIFYIGYILLFPSNVVMVASAEGVVEIEKGGRWIAIREGMKLREGVIIRTKRGKVVLQYKKGANIVVADNSIIKVEKATGDALHLVAREGVVRARISTGSPVLLIRDNRDDVLNVTEGEFAVNVDRKGFRVAVSKEGKGLFITKDGIKKEVGRNTKLTIGETVTVSKVKPEKLPLNVDFPHSPINTPQAEIKGRTSPEATVYINGEVVRPDRMGYFSFVLSLEEGKNEINVLAIDLMGRSVAKKTEIYVDLTPPPLKLKKKNIWE